MKRAGEPLNPEAASVPSANDAFAPPAALKIASHAGAPPGAESVYQYVENNAQSIAPAEEGDESSLALSLLLIGKINQLYTEEHPDADLVRSFVTLKHNHLLFLFH